jgi:hypothetical protein
MDDLVKRSTRRAMDESETTRITEKQCGRRGRAISVQQRLQAFHPKQERRCKRGFDTRSAKPYYLCTVVLLDISKDSDIINSYELLSRGATDQYAKHKRGREGMKMEGEGSNEGGRSGSTETGL